MFQSPKATTTRVAIVIIALGLSTLGLTVGAAEKSEGIALLRLPFMGVNFKMTSESEARFEKWTAGVLASELPTRDLEILVTLADWSSIDPKIATDLPRTSGGRTVRLLSPLCENEDVDGVLAFWLERSELGEYQLVSLFYLPERIRLQALIVSANFERQSLQLNADGNADSDTASDVLTSLLRRNLDRIILEPAAAKPIEMAPVNDSVSVVEPTSTDSQSSIENGSTPRFPMAVGVLDLSRDFLEPSETVAERYSKKLVNDSFKRQIRNAIKPLKDYVSGTQPIDEPPVTFNQIEAPVLGLDPNADPHAKEKRLAQLAGDADALLFGHLHQERESDGSMRMMVYLRLFLKDDSSLHTVNSRLKPKDDLKLVLQKKAREVFAGTREPDVVILKIKPKDNLVNIVKRCYNFETNALMKVVEILAQRNGIQDPDKISHGGEIKIFKEVAGARRKKECR